MLRYVVALKAEARPLVERYRLRHDPRSTAFAIYRRDDTALVVSGPGKVAAAAATAYLHLHLHLHSGGGGSPAAWLNVGIAAHGTRPVGEAVVAHKIRDRAADRSWYPPQVFPLRWPGDEVVTVDRVERRLAEPGAHEMEASGFYPTACRFVTAELVQCLKIVSDGPGVAPESLTARRVETLIGDNLEAVEWLSGECVRLAGEVGELEADPPELAECVARWHFTLTESRQLRRLLRRRQTLAPEQPLPFEGLKGSLRGKQINRRLRDWLDSLPVELG